MNHGKKILDVKSFFTIKNWCCKDTKDIKSFFTKKNSLDIGIKSNEQKNKKEVQSHGFTWEQDILLNVYKLTEEERKGICYTSKYDLPCSLNKIDGKNISIKTSKSKNAVCMADCLRFYDCLCNDSFHCVVLFYEQINNDKMLNKVYEIDLTNAVDIMFGTISRNELEKLVDLVKSVPQRRKPTEEEYKNMYEYRDSIQKKSGFVHLDIKCNSQQSRLQCSFTRFNDFIKTHKDRVIEESVNSLKGINILSTIISPSRTFNKK